MSLVCNVRGDKGSRLSQHAYHNLSKVSASFLCVCVCVCVCERERERESGKKKSTSLSLSSPRLAFMSVINILLASLIRTSLPLYTALLVKPHNQRNNWCGKQDSQNTLPWHLFSWNDSMRHRNVFIRLWNCRKYDFLNLGMGLMAKKCFTQWKLHL